jgi:hypothetical protein
MPEVSEIVDVTISVQSSALSRKGFNSLMIVGGTSDFDSGFDEYEVRKYTSYSQISDDADILDGDLKNRAQVAFAQSPSVPEVYISKADNTKVAQVADCAVPAGNFSPGVSEWTVLIDGEEVPGSPFPYVASFEQTMENSVKPALEADPRIASAPFDGGTDTFTITGELSAGSFTVEVNDVPQGDTSTFTVTTPGEAGFTAASLDAIAANNNEWFGYAQVFEDVADIQTASSWVASNKKYGFFLQTGFNAGMNLNSNYSCLWYTDNSYTGTARPLEVAIASRILALVPGSYTAAFKSLELVSTTQLTATQESDLRAENVNQYSVVAGENITWTGETSSGSWIDLYIGVLYLEARVEEDVFATIKAREKVPFTNDGINLVVGAVQNRLQQSVEEQFLTNDPAPVTTAPLASEVSDTDKSNRLLTPVTFTAYTAGAIHTVKINGTVVA